MATSNDALGVKWSDPIYCGCGHSSAHTWMENGRFICDACHRAGMVARTCTECGKPGADFYPPGVRCAQCLDAAAQAAAKAAVELAAKAAPRPCERCGKGEATTLLVSGRTVCNRCYDALRAAGVPNGAVRGYMRDRGQNYESGGDSNWVFGDVSSAVAAATEFRLRAHKHDGVVGLDDQTEPP